MNQHSGNVSGLPHKCFISHSYIDAAACNVLRETLPRDVESCIFPPMNVAPDQMVSNELVSAILPFLRVALCSFDSVLLERKQKARH